VDASFVGSVISTPPTLTVDELTLTVDDDTAVGVTTAPVSGNADSRR
jgi:hypothetical protein